MKQKLKIKIPAKSVLSYSIWFGSNLLKQPKKWLSSKAVHYIVITDHTVKKYYGVTLLQYLRQQGFQATLFSFPAGEKYKNAKTKMQLENQMLARKYDRSAMILAIGGGVVGDLAGFIAATYMRGIAYINIPTTLLSMVDSSIGGKTAIDTKFGKNLIGAFWQPKNVVIDFDCLMTLPQRQFVNGLIEAIKIFLTCDQKYFTFIEKNITKILKRDKKLIRTVIHRAIKLKANVVQQDETELHLRALLNFGHTVGHALEQASHYKLLHGYAVAYGILLEAKITELMGNLSTENYQRIVNLFKKLNIHAKDLKKFSVTKLIQLMQGDKKSKAKKIHCILLKKIGAIYQPNKKIIHPITSKMIKRAWLALLKD